MKQQARVNVVGILSCILVIPTFFHNAVDNLIYSAWPEWYTQKTPVVLIIVVIVTVFVLLLSAVVLGIIGLAQRHRPHMRWMALVGLSLGTIQILVLMFT